VLADTWLSMAQLDRRLHQEKEAEAFESQNREMWDQLNRKYPRSSYILKRMAVASSK
jgi:hypothetical protein